MLRRIGACRKTVMQLLRLLGSKADVVRSLIKRYDDKSKAAKSDYKHTKEIRKAQHEVTLYLGDIQGKKKKELHAETMRTLKGEML